MSLPAEAARLEQFHWIQQYKVGAENACRQFADSSAARGVLDQCVPLDGMNSVWLSKTKWVGQLCTSDPCGNHVASPSALHCLTTKEGHSSLSPHGGEGASCRIKS